MDLIYYGPLFRSRTRKVLYGQILKGDWVPLTNKMSGKIDKRPYRNFSQAINENYKTGPVGMAQKFNFHIPHLRYTRFDLLNICRIEKFSNFSQNCANPTL